MGSNASALKSLFDLWFIKNRLQFVVLGKCESDDRHVRVHNQSTGIDWIIGGVNTLFVLKKENKKNTDLYFYEMI